jgi:prefoldin subunit 2
VCFVSEFVLLVSLPFPCTSKPRNTQQAMSAEADASSVPPVVQYRELMSECQQLMTKVAELETDKTEHVLVEETLKPLDGNRRAYRLVGDVLVERTVAEVLPSITKNKDNVRLIC